MPPSHPNVSEERYEKDMVQVNSKLDCIQASVTKIETSLFERRGLYDVVEKIEKRTEILEQDSAIFKQFRKQLLVVGSIVSITFSSIVLFIKSWFSKNP